MSYLFQLPIYQTPHTATVMFNNELKECTESPLQPAGHTYAQTSMRACGKCPSEKYTQPNSLVKTFSSLFRLRSRVATPEKVKCYPKGIACLLPVARLTGVSSWRTGYMYFQQFARQREGDTSGALLISSRKHLARATARSPFKRLTACSSTASSSPAQLSLHLQESSCIFDQRGRTSVVACTVYRRRCGVRMCNWMLKVKVR